MVLALWISLLGISLVVSFTPGAGAINTMSNALAVGWRRSFWGVIGQQFGILAHIVVAAAGVGVIVMNSPVAFTVVRYAGAGYLIFIGLQQFFAKPSATAQAVPAPDASRTVELASAPVMTGSVQVLTKSLTRAVADEGTHDSKPESEAGASAWQLVRRGFWVNLLNPKAVVFFLAFMPQFIAVDAPVLPQYLVIALTMTVIDAAVMWCVYAVAAEQFRRFTGSPRGQVVTNRIFGTLFMLIAVLMLLLN